MMDVKFIFFIIGAALLFLYLFSIELLPSVSVVRQLNSKIYFTKTENYRTNTGSTITPKQDVVIGIFSKLGNFCLREALRKTIIFRAKEYRYFDIKVFFIIDNSNAELEKEQRKSNDILFLNTTITGWNNHFAKKLHMWISYVINNFPKAVLLGKLDDDVFVCTPQVFDRLYEVMHPLLYYGYPTGAGFPEAVDDMFMFLGIELARRISKQKVCENATEKHCLHDGNSAHMFRQWISKYKDLEFVNEKDNNKMIWFYQGTSKDIKNTLKLFRTKSFCDSYLVYHKASHHEIYRMAKWNVERLNEQDSSKYTSNSTKCAHDVHRLP